MLFIQYECLVNFSVNQKPADLDQHCSPKRVQHFEIVRCTSVLLDFSLTVKAAPHECVIRTGKP